MMHVRNERPSCCEVHSCLVLVRVSSERFDAGKSCIMHDQMLVQRAINCLVVCLRFGDGLVKGKD